MINSITHQMLLKMSANAPKVAFVNINNLNKDNNCNSLVVCFVDQNKFNDYNFSNLVSQTTKNQIRKSLHENSHQRFANVLEEGNDFLHKYVLTIDLSMVKMLKEHEVNKIAQIVQQKVSTLFKIDTVDFIIDAATKEKLNNVKALAVAFYNTLPFNDNRFKSKYVGTEKALEFSIKNINIDTDVEDRDELNKLNQVTNVILQAKTYTRLIANLPSNICTPEFMSKLATELSKEFTNLDTIVYDEISLSKLNMNAYLSVAKGSSNRPFMSVISYNGNNAENRDPIVFIGKGLTFDSGGISLKPGQDMDEMMFDKCGACSVLGLMLAIAQLKPKHNIIGIISCAENIPSSKSYKPGDIIESKSGTTIEVLNTDAEGRLVLCDSITYAKSYNPAKIIDIATLTGACLIALGHQTTGLFSNDDQLVKDLLDSSLNTSDIAWHMPIGDLYNDMINARFADVANTGGRLAGATTAAQFLHRFVENTPWCHLDIAGSAWHSGSKSKTATGRPIALLIDYILK